MRPAPVEAQVSISDIWMTSKRSALRVRNDRPSSCARRTSGRSAIRANVRWLPVSRPIIVSLTSIPVIARLPPQMAASRSRPPPKPITATDPRRR